MSKGLPFIELCKIAGCSESTLRTAKRFDPTFPKPIPSFAKKPLLYDRGQFVAWLEQQTKAPNDTTQGGV